VFFVRLTLQGRRQIENILPEQVSRIKNEMSTLSKGEQNELQRLCKKIGVNV
jgi:DNA-binding MarR family transcriptional regulator